MSLYSLDREDPETMAPAVVEKAPPAVKPAAEQAVPGGRRLSR